MDKPCQKTRAILLCDIYTVTIRCSFVHSSHNSRDWWHNGLVIQHIFVTKPSLQFYALQYQSLVLPTFVDHQARFNNALKSRRMKAKTKNGWYEKRGAWGREREGRKESRLDQQAALLYGSLIIRRTCETLFRYASLEKHLHSRRNVTIIELAISKHFISLPLSLFLYALTRLREHERV